MTSGHDRSSGSLAPASGFDVLSDMLRTVRLTGAMLFVVEAATPWVSWAPQSEAFRHVVLPAAQHLISLHIVTCGGCWAGLMGAPPQRFETGDVLVIPHGDAYYLADPPEAERTYGHVEAVNFFRDMAAGRMPSTVSEGGDGPGKSQFICGFLGCDFRPFNPVLWCCRHYPACFVYDLRPRRPTACLTWSHSRCGSCVRIAQAVRS
jgi:hypothetical protein